MGPELHDDDDNDDEGCMVKQRQPTALQDRVHDLQELLQHILQGVDRYRMVVVRKDDVVHTLGVRMARRVVHTRYEVKVKETAEQGLDPEGAAACVARLWVDSAASERSRECHRLSVSEGASTEVPLRSHKHPLLQHIYAAPQRLPFVVTRGDVG